MLHDTGIVDSDSNVVMNTFKRRLVGVLGGMGPMATVDFLSKIIWLTPAAADQEHVPLIVHQVPQIPDRSAAILTGSDAPLNAMLDGLRKLARAGVDFAVIPCNTAHHWYGKLTQLQELPLLHIAEAVRQEVALRELQNRRMAIMATRGTNRARVYHDHLGQAVELLLPVDESVQELIDRAIFGVKQGKLEDAAGRAIEAANLLLSSGAEVLVLGCTELPLALEKSGLQDRCIDSTLALARLCVKESMRPAVVQ